MDNLEVNVNSYSSQIRCSTRIYVFSNGFINDKLLLNLCNVPIYHKYVSYRVYDKIVANGNGNVVFPCYKLVARFTISHN